MSKFCAKYSQMPHGAELRTCRPALAEGWPKSAKLGWIRSDLLPGWNNLPKQWPNSARIGRMRAKTRLPGTLEGNAAEEHSRNVRPTSELAGGLGFWWKSMR